MIMFVTTENKDKENLKLHIIGILITLKQSGQEMGNGI